MWTRVSIRMEKMMLDSKDIEQYKILQKETADANTEKQQMLAEIKILKKQGLERLKKYGFESFSDIPKLKAKLETLESQILKEKDEMRNYCAYIADKKMEKMTLFNQGELI